MSDIADKQSFGPKLDAYEKELEEYQKLSEKLKTNPNDDKGKKRHP